MYELNGNDFADRASNSVCAQCFNDKEIYQFIEDIDASPGCSFCGYKDSPTAPIDIVCDYVRECLLEFFAFAVDNLPYEGKEGGYLWPHWNTYELLYDKLEFDLPRDRDGRLSYMITQKVGEEVWCERDWLSLDYSKMLEHSWEKFCWTIQHQRRFFFAIPEENGNRDKSWFCNREEFNAPELLSQFVRLANELDLVQTLPVGTKFYRSRRCQPHAQLEGAHELGPPPLCKAFQSNRMNPPGIPMMYGSETKLTAIHESGAPYVSVGKFEFARDVRILDLADLPEIPSIFSGIERRKLLGLVFMHAFAKDIARPICRDDRSIHFEYIPSQVITEYIRISKFDCGLVDGVRYPSNIHDGGRNFVLFATQDHLLEPDGTPVSQLDNSSDAPWIRLVESTLNSTDRSPN